MDKEINEGKGDAAQSSGPGSPLQVLAEDGSGSGYGYGYEIIEAEHQRTNTPN